MKSLLKSVPRLIVFGIAACIFLLSSPLEAKQEKFTRRQSLGRNLKAAIAVVASHKQKKKALRAMNQAFTRARSILSTLDERNGKSETALLNQNAGGTSIQAGSQLLYLLARGQQLSELTGGGFDMTLGSRSSKASYRDIWIDRANSLVAIKRRRTRVSVWSIVRGYLADGMAKILRQEGLNHFLINVGGKLHASGQDLKGSWMVGVQDPLSRPGESVCRLPLRNQGLASTSFRTYRIDTGSKVSSPLYASISIVAPDAATADALAHAGMMLGERARSVMQSVVGVAAVFVDGQGRVEKIGRIAAACFSR